MRLRDLRVALALLPFIFLSISCMGTRIGSDTLSADNANQVEEGKTTKQEIAKLLGHPSQMMNLDKNGLEEYVYRLTLDRPAADTFPAGNYEVWTYNNTTYRRSLFTPGASQTDRNLVLIINGSDLCVKKLYDEKSKGSW